MRRLVGVVALSATLLWSTAAVTMAVTDGELDLEGHPYVGLMTATAPEGGGWRCSGTLISPWLFLTAGHCTFGAVGKIQIWFDADVQSGIPGNGYPNEGQVEGDPYTHPGYIDSAFYLYDLGIVVLDEPKSMSQYGALPEVGQFDALKTKRGLQKTTFTSVGYGLQQSFPDAASWKENNQRVRMVAHPRLIQINGGIAGDSSLLLSNNANTGGTCFGDSGGPNFVGDSSVIAGVTSFAMNGTCAGTGGVYRIDQADDLGWIATFMD